MVTIYTAPPITWTDDTIGNKNTFNAEIKDKMTNIDNAITAEVTQREVDIAVVMARITAIYPIGCIYTTVVATNPVTLFGFGTWVAFGAGKVLVGLNAAETEFDTVEETGGEKTHTLTTAEMPAHIHSGAANLGTQHAFSAGDPHQTSLVTNVDTGLTGGGSAHNNLQPYITVYFFKRTA